MPSFPFLTTGRVVQSLIGLSCSIGPYVADFNETHIYNPNWPPHARFHNGQTMSMGLTLGLLTQYLVWRPVFNKAVNPKDTAFLAAVTGSLYWITGMSAILYPGTTWVDPEFREKFTNGDPQAPVFAAHAILAWLGYALTVRGLRGIKMA